MKIVLQFQEGKISSERTYVDLVSFLKQAGFLIIEAP